MEMRSESIPEMLKLKLSLRSTVISFQMSTANPRQSYPGPKLADCDQKGHPKRFEKRYLQKKSKKKRGPDTAAQETMCLEKPVACQTKDRAGRPTVPGTRTTTLRRFCWSGDSGRLFLCEGPFINSLSSIVVGAGKTDARGAREFCQSEKEECQNSVASYRWGGIYRLIFKSN